MDAIADKDKVVEKVRKNARVVKKMTEPKRKKIVLNFIQKVEILEKLKTGIRVVDLAKEYNIGLSTVCDIRKYGETKLVQFRKEHLFSMTRKTFKAPDFPLLDKALRLWIYQERTKNYILTDPIFAHKALFFFAQLYPNAKKVFKASYGYVDKFCKRYDISLRNEPSKMYADLTKIEIFIQDFQSFDYTPDQIYNADECGINFEEIPVLKPSKNSLTLLLCCNATGKHRLPLVVVNNQPSPFNANLPVRLACSERAWMNLEIFESWFHEEFVPQVRAHLSSLNLEEKAILLVDNCPAHPMKLQSADGKIKGLFVPPDSSALIMPMNQGPISYLKRKYRTNLLRNTLLDNTGSSRVKSALYSLANLWSELPDDLLASSWHKLGTNLNTKYIFEKIDMQEIRTNLNKLGLNLSDHEINSWLDTDYGEPGYGFFTDQEIIQACQKNTLTNVTFDTEEPPMNEDTISSKEAYTRCGKLMVWLEQNRSSKPGDLISMQRIKELAFNKHLFASVLDESNNESLAYIDEDAETETPQNKLDECIESVASNKALTTNQKEQMSKNKMNSYSTSIKLNESNGDMDKTTFLDEENTGNMLRLEGGDTIKKRRKKF